MISCLTIVTGLIMSSCIDHLPIEASHEVYEMFFVLLLTVICIFLCEVHTVLLNNYLNYWFDVNNILSLISGISNKARNILKLQYYTDNVTYTLTVSLHLKLPYHTLC